MKRCVDVDSLAKLCETDNDTLEHDNLRSVQGRTDLQTA
jgi:hypothetical protein